MTVMKSLAFPHIDSGCGRFEPGMTLRDYFAAKALPSVYDSAIVDASQGSGLFSDPDWRIGLALDAYAMADAMLKAREA